MTINFDKLNYLKSLVSLKIPKMSRLLFLLHSIVQRRKTRREEEGKVKNA